MTWEVEYTVDEAEVAFMDRFGVTPATDCDSCNSNQASSACCSETCCGVSVNIQEDDGVTLEFTPPENFVGEAVITLNIDSQGAETANLQRTMTMTVAVPECMRRTEDVDRTPTSYCGENGIRSGPNGCKCDVRWYGEQCNRQ